MKTNHAMRSRLTPVMSLAVQSEQIPEGPVIKETMASTTSPPHQKGLPMGRAHKPELRSQKQAVHGSKRHSDPTEAKTPDSVQVDQENPVPLPERAELADLITSTSEAKETIRDLRGSGTTGTHSGGTDSVVVSDDGIDKCK